MNKGQKLYKIAKKYIPGGTQLLSKRPEMFLPDYWPSYYQKAKGCEVWDLDNKKYIDMSYMGIGACILGYADEDIDCAVKNAIDAGNMSTLNVPEEVELAKLFINFHPWAEMVRYTRTGGEAMTVAVRIARAKTGKDKILFCGYHGWHDWYLSANLADDKSLDGHLLPGLKPKGVPRILKGSAIPFQYNQTKEFLKLFDRHKKKIAAVVMEPIRNYYPEKGFLETIRSVTQKAGIVLIFDEVSAGFRLTTGGAHMIFHIYPDIAVFSKALANGFPMAAIIGRKEVMKAAEDTFISSTYWTDKIGPIAAIHTIKKYKRCKVQYHLNKIGKEIQQGWKTIAKKKGINIEVFGIFPLSHFSFKYKNALALKTLFTQEMLKRGFLATASFYASYAHKRHHVEEYLKAYEEVFLIIKKALTEGKIEKYLNGSVCQEGFKRLN